MGTITKGILDGFSGKVGTVVGSNWNGVQVMRSKPGKRKKPSSQAQIEQQARFALMVDFLQPVADLLNESFGRARGMSQYNKAISYNIQVALTGAYPDFGIDFSKVVLAKGRVPGPQAPVASSPSAGKLALTWTDNSSVQNAKASDQLVVAAYCDVLKHWILVPNAAARNAGNCTVDLSAFSGKPVQTWLSFASDSGRFAPSMFTGAVNIL